ncbi:MAG: hypothetical protein FJW14_17475 [Acidimicrobiia bacterium]|nr:hypothetical protein [Acidimicrobiia bacterium]
MLLCVLVMNPPLAAAQDAAQPRPRLDAYLRAAASAPEQTTQRVIVRVRAGARDTVRAAIAEAGDQAISGLGASSLVALVRSDRLLTLAAHEDVLGLSSDGKVRPHAGAAERRVPESE